MYNDAIKQVKKPTEKTEGFHDQSSVCVGVLF